MRRNAFGRLWWRVYLLHQPEWKNPYELLNWLVEDDLVQITERNSLASSPELVTVFCLSFVRILQHRQRVPRRILMREAVKRVRRLQSIVVFTALDARTLQTLIDGVFAETLAALDQQTDPTRQVTTRDTQAVNVPQ